MNLWQLMTLILGSSGFFSMLISWRLAKPRAANILIASGDKAVLTLQRVIDELEAENVRKEKMIVQFIAEVKLRDDTIKALTLKMEECQKELAARCQRLRNDVTKVANGLQATQKQLKDLPPHGEVKGGGLFGFLRK